MNSPEATAKEANIILLGGNLQPALNWLTDSEGVGLDVPELWIDSVNKPETVPEEDRWPGRRYHLAYSTRRRSANPKSANSTKR